jgi:hypothetical protein
MSGLFLFGGLGLVVTMLFPVVLLLAFLVILALRHDDDVDGSRAPAIYGAVVAFIALLTILVSVTGVASSLAQLTASDDGGRSPSPMMERRAAMEEYDEFDDLEMYEDETDNDDAAISSAIGFLIAGLAAAGLLAAHRSLFERRQGATGAALRVHRAYALAFCLVVALIAMAAGGGTLYTVWRAAAPGVAGAENRADELRTLVPMIVLSAGAAFLWKRHWAEVEPTREEATVTP